MSHDLQNELKHHFGFTEFRPGQTEAIHHLLSKQNALVVMPTGAGKSLCYQLPGVLSRGTTLVVSPLIALMKDQVESLLGLRHAATFINSSLSQSEQSVRVQGMRAGEYQLVYVAPERFRSHSFLAALSETKVDFFVVDEAHCISHWGHDFRPDYLTLRRIIREVGSPPVMALTATATLKVQDDIIRQLELKSCKRTITGFNRPNLSFEVEHATDESDKYTLLENLLKREKGSAIVYVGTRRQAEEVAEFARLVCRRKTEYYHAGLNAGERSRIQESFMKGETSVIVATNAFGMGVDKPDIRSVTHFSIPGTLEAYYQEAGRAGRDGLPARCVLLYAPQDRSLQEWFIDNDAPEKDEFEDLYGLLLAKAQDRKVRISFDYLQTATRLYETKLRVGLAELVRAGFLKELGDDRRMMNYTLSRSSWPDFSPILLRIRKRRRYKYQQLQQIVRYAEEDLCRRKFILDHFGDTSEPVAERCCDTCLSQSQSTSSKPQENYTYSETEKAALIILHAVKYLPRSVGRTRLVEILTGSKSRTIFEYGWNKTKHYGRLQHFSQVDCRDFVDQLLKKRYVKLVGSDYPVLKLTARGAQALRDKAPIALQSTLSYTPAPAQSPLRSIGKLTPTHRATLAGFRQGLSVEEIAEKRNLTVGTIYEHMANLIALDLVKVTALVSPEKVRGILQAISVAGAVSLKAIVDVLPDGYTYDEVRCVRADYLRRTRDSKPARASTEPGIDLDLFERLREFRTKLAKENEMPPFVFFHDSVLKALAATKPRSLGELSRIKGLGPSKIEKYGRTILEIVDRGF